MEKILDGRKAAIQIKHKVAEAVKEFYDRRRLLPYLATILVGDDSASKIYVQNKQKDCEVCGIRTLPIDLPGDISEQSLIDVVKRLSDNKPDVDAILIQLPLPKHICKERIIEFINPKKDVDCFTPYNTGLLFQGAPKFLPCTPGGIIELLKTYNINLSGKHCVVVGRSNLVGKPMAMLALQNNATVTICHSYTKNLNAICREADILISAVGKPNFINLDMVTDNTIMIDVGINHDKAGKLCGDCDPLIYEKVAAYTPVPGGIGQMTRAMLMKNTAIAAGLEVD